MRSLLLVPVLLLLLVAACGGKETAAEPPAGEVLQRAVKAFAGLRSFHFKLTHENGATPIPLNLQLTSAEGDAALPDRLAADVRAKAGPLTASVKLVAIGDRTWITNPFSRDWQLLSGVSAGDIADPSSLVAAVVDRLQGVSLGGRSEVGSVETYRLTGTLPSEALQSSLGVARPGHVLKVDLWIGVEDGLPRRVRLTGPLVSGEAEDIVRQVDLSKFNEAVDIRPPS